MRDPVNVENIWRQNRDRLGFEGVTTHALRKTAATGLDVAGVSARGIAEYLGHTKPSLTQDVYMSRNVGSSAAAEHLDRCLERVRSCGRGQFINDRLVGRLRPERDLAEGAALAGGRGLTV